MTTVADNALSSGQPFLFRFKMPVPLLNDSHEIYQESFYSASLQLNTTHEGEIVWRAARYKIPPTSCSTAGHTIPAGYTSTGKYKPAKYVPSKTDKRAGK
jgi:hypothetical protein